MFPGYKTPCLLAALILTQITLPAYASALAEALEQAWTLHPPAAALDAHAAAAQARVEMASSLTPGPAVISLGHLNDQLGSDRGKQEWDIELSAPLWLAGQKAGSAGVAASAAEAIAARRTALRLELAGKLRAAWWTLAAARLSQQLAQRRLDSARSLEADVMRRYRSGDLARVDANQSRGETLAAQASSLQIEAELRQVERHWRSLTGSPPPAQLAAEALPHAAFDADHPHLTWLDSTRKVAQAQLKLTQHTSRDAPELAVRLLRERGDKREPFGNAIGFKLSIPFTSGPRLRRDSAAASAELAEVEVELRQTAQRLALDIEQAGLELANAEQQQVMARERRELAADSLQLAEKSFRLGESDLTALLRVRAAAFEAEASLIRQEVARDSAVSRLKQALGQLP